MKHLFTFIGLILIAVSASAQLTPNLHPRSFDANQVREDVIRTYEANRTVTCGEDTNAYAAFKATNTFNLWTIRDGFAFTQVGQYFDASPTNPVTISGFDFFAVGANGANNISIPVTCALYAADVATDSTPIGAPLAVTTVNVDTSFNAWQRNAVFPQSYVATAPFVLVLSNNSTDTLSILINGFNDADGDGECISMAFAPSLNAWNQGCELAFGAGGTAPFFDVDVIIEPYTTLDITATAGLVDGETCYLADAETVTLGGSASDMATSRMYNRWFNPYSSFFSPDSAFLWDMKDGTFIAGDTVNHVYTAAGVYQPELGLRTLGFRLACTDVASTAVTVGVVPTPSFDATVDSATISVTVNNTSTDFETLSYDFGDGNTSTTGATTHTYDSAGTYTITLTAFGCDTSATTTTEITIPANTTSIATLDPAAVNVFPNPSTGLFTVELASSVSGSMNLRVSNVMGQEILRKTADNKTVIDLSGFQAGIYLLQGEVNGRGFTKTLRVE